MASNISELGQWQSLAKAIPNMFIGQGSFSAFCLGEGWGISFLIICFASVRWGIIYINLFPWENPCRGYSVLVDRYTQAEEESVHFIFSSQEIHM